MYENVNTAERANAMPAFPTSKRDRRRRRATSRTLSAALGRSSTNVCEPELVERRKRAGERDRIAKLRVIAITQATATAT